MNISSKNSYPYEYDSYIYTLREKFLYVFEGMSVMFLLGYIFYHNAILSFLLSLTGLVFLKIKKKSIIVKRKWELNIQFKDLLYFLNTSLSAGRSLENSFRSALTSLKGLYSEENGYIVRETEAIIGKLEMNGNIEECLYDLSKRSGIEDISNFTDVLITCKRKGGNLNEVIRNTSSVIKDRIEMKQEIEIMLTGKKSEQLILSVSPIAMILFLTYTAYDFIKPAFETLIGNIVMTFALGLIAVGIFWSKKIMDISM